MGRVFIILSLVFSVLVFAQSERDMRALAQSSQSGMVTISGTASFDQAIDLLSKTSKRAINKVIISEIPNSTPIGIDIDLMHWYKALQLISKLHDYEIYENHEYLKVVPLKNLTKTVEVPDALKGVDFETREVAISAVFFELDVNRSKETGMNWKWLLSREGINVGSELGKTSSSLFSSGGTEGSESSTSSQASSGFSIGANSEFKVLNMMGKATTLFNFFESNNLGEIIASPQITVRDRVKGEIQVGADFSTREKDFAGNTIERFYSTGTIIRVTPYVLNENGKNYVLLDLSVERSTALPGQFTTEVKRTKATTNALLLDGEETIIGGLFINEERTERSGIPILKDLPWWVFGIRYLTGSDVQVTAKKELIIVLKARLLPTLKERLVDRSTDTRIIDSKLHQYDQEINRYRTKK
ncbi:MAG: type II and III secretion system protein [Ignavibacteria bacterium]|nr:type II and III secretion system protein [Ignavibacteria bacterium]